MPRAVLVALLLATPGLAGAQPAVEILSPTAGACVASGLPVQDGGAPGGEPFVPAVDVRLQLRLTSPSGAPLTVRVRADGDLVAERQVDAPGADPFETDAVFVPALGIDDGLGRTVEVTVEDGDGSATDAVTFDLDRAPPVITFDEPTLALLSVCHEQGLPAVAYAVDDAVDPAPEVAEADEAAACVVDRVITARDHCGAGNAVAVRFPLPVPAAQAPTPIIDGVVEGARVFDATVTYRVEAPPACVGQVTATYTIDGGDARGLVPGRTLTDAGNYTVRVEVTACGQDAAVAERHFTIVSRPRANPGGPYEAFQGQPLVLDASGSTVPPEAGEISSWAWDVDADGFFDAVEGTGPQTAFDTAQPDGVYDVGVRVRTDLGFETYGYTTVTLLDVTPACDAGGPYTVLQGEPLTLDGTASVAGADLEPIVAFDWDFGDDVFPQRGLNARPVHRYEDEGEFTVTLRVEDVDSACEATATVQVQDIEPVIANLRARDADGLVEGQSVVFSAGQTSAGSAAEPLTGFTWDFGDGETAEGFELRGPTHTYLDDGDFQVCLEVSDVDSTVEDCIEVRVADLTPTARLAGPGFALEGQTVTFDAGGSRAGGAADPFARYVWDFGDGTDPVEVLDPDATTIEHTYAANGDLLVTLQVWDEDGFAEATHRIFVDDVRPVARLVGPLDAVAEGAPAPFDASTSAPGSASDPIVNYRWDFGDGESAEGPEPTITHAFGDQGTYLVRVEVVDGDGSVSAVDRVVQVVNAPPADIVIEGPAQAEAGVPSTWRVTWADVAADPGRARWTLGDGTTVDNQVEVTHGFAETGLFRLRVTVDDGDGGVAEGTLDVEVTGAAPRFEGPTEVEVAEGEPVEILLRVRSAPLGPALFDGPVRVRVPVSPVGAAVEVVPGSPPEAQQTVVTRWTPGAADAGTHRVRVVARAPSGIERAHEVTVRVTDGGAPRLVTLAGRDRLGVYGFGWDALAQRRTFTALADVPLGGLANDVVVGPAGRRAFVAVPGVGVVVVDLTATPARRVRAIDVGPAPQAVASDGELIWALGQGSLTGIDPGSLKVVVRARDARLPAAVEALWVPAIGRRGGRLAAVAGGGDLSLIDPAPVRTGEAPGVEGVAIGGRLARVASDVTADRLVLADVAGRRVVWWHGADGVVGEAALPFAPTSLAPVGADEVWVITERGLEVVDVEGGVRVRQRARLGAVAVLPPTLYGFEVLAIGSAGRVDALAADDLTLIDGVRAGGARRLRFTLVAP
ncbi:MAG: PKD domain-containing protein [Myxococcales bacterium]|nr:PKD domain-containing protein [Myxococcales bacterium]